MSTINITIEDGVESMRYLPDFGYTGRPNCAADYRLARLGRLVLRRAQDEP